jgi:hypothetical protein
MPLTMRITMETAVRGKGSMLICQCPPLSRSVRGACGG